MTRDWQSLETPAFPQSGLPKEDQTRTETENFLVCPRGNEKQLGMLLEISNLLWLETNQDYAQKTVQYLELAQKTIKVQQLPKNAQNHVKWVWKWILLDSAEFWKIRKNQEWCHKFPRTSEWNFGMQTYQREPNDKCARSWTYRFRRSIEAGEICFLPSGQYRSSHRFPSSKLKQQDDHVKEIATALKREIVLYH